MAALFYLFFTDTEFTSQEKLFVFSSCGGNGAIAFVGFITENSWYHRLYNACQGIPTKIRYYSLFSLIILVKKALLLTGILSCIFPFSGTFEYIIGLILLFANIKRVFT
jgi:hypothetical protein